MKKTVKFLLFLIFAMPISLTLTGCGKSLPEGTPTTEEEIDAAAIQSAEEQTQSVE